MKQLPLPFDAIGPSLTEATAQRDAILTDLEEANGPDFGQQAADFVLGYLREHGDSSGETITDAALAAGIRPESGDTRRFGPVYAVLARQGLIVRRGYCQRRKGHNTSGASVWGLK